MRALMILLLAPAVLAAAPPAAKPAAKPAAEPAAKQAAIPTIALPPELTDPKMAAAMGRMMGAMTKAMLDMPVGELEAAIANRPATAADRRKKLRDVADAGAIERQVAQSGPMIQGMTRALAARLPAMIAAVEQAGGTIEAEVGKAVGNLPDPTYPRR